MSRNGVWQCKRLTVNYCKHGGSSNGIRDLVLGEQKIQIEEWKKQNPQVELHIRKIPHGRYGVHPFLRADYVDGTWNTVTVKNEQPEDILQRLEWLKNRWSTHQKTWTEDKHTRVKKSLQGPWNPYINFLDKEFTEPIDSIPLKEKVRQ